MSLQDDIFDLDHALKNKPAAEAWRRVRDHLYVVEKISDRRGAVLKDLAAGVRGIRNLMEGDI